MQIVQWFDVIVIGMILILGVKGVLNGLIKESFGLIGLVGGLIVASRYSEYAGDFIANNIYNITNKSMLGFVGFLSLWLCFWLFSLFAGNALSRLIGVSGLGFLDKIGGFVIGSGKIFLVLSAIFAVISHTNLNTKIEPYFQGSKVYPILLHTGKWIANMDKDNIKKHLNSVSIKKEDKSSKVGENVKLDSNDSINPLDDNETKELQ